MNNIFTIMIKELFRYLSDRRMLLTTILLPGLMKLLLVQRLNVLLGLGALSEDIVEP